MNKLDNTTYSDLIAAMPEMAEAVNAFDGDATRREALRSLLRTKLGAQPVSNVRQKKRGNGTAKAKARRTTGKSSTKQVSRSGPKSSPDLNLRTNGLPSFAEFVTEKRPKNQRQKSAVVLYYLQKTMSLSDITIDEVYTAYKDRSWPVPTDMTNHLQQVKSVEGWIDTANMADIKLTIPGENFVEHELPAASSTA